MKKIAIYLALAVLPTIGVAKEVTLPQDTVFWRPSSLPGYQLTLQNCSTCHSAHYAEYQPPNSGKAYWQGAVLKMKNIFKAPINENDIPAIVEYLTQTYGDHRK